MMKSTNARDAHHPALARALHSTRRLIRYWPVMVTRLWIVLGTLRSAVRLKSQDNRGGRVFRRHSRGEPDRQVSSYHSSSSSAFAVTRSGVSNPSVNQA